MVGGMGVDVCRDTFSGGGEGGNNGTARIVRFVDFGKGSSQVGAVLSPPC